MSRGTPFFPALDEPLKLEVETPTVGSRVAYLRYQALARRARPRADQ